MSQEELNALLDGLFCIEALQVEDCHVTAVFLDHSMVEFTLLV